VTLQDTTADEFIRCQAISLLARGWKDEPDIFPLIKNMAKSEVDPFIRLSAMQALAEVWKDDRDMLNFFLECAVDESFDVIKHKYVWVMNSRQLALEIIIKQYRDRPRTLPLLQDRAKNDPDEKVREFAKEKLAELEKLPNPPGN
jgi:HEAT repeat protein